MPRIGQAPQRTQGAVFPHRRPRSFAHWPRSGSLVVRRTTAQPAPCQWAKALRSNGSLSLHFGTSADVFDDIEIFITQNDAMVRLATSAWMTSKSGQAELSELSTEAGQDQPYASAWFKISSAGCVPSSERYDLRFIFQPVWVRKSSHRFAPTR